MEISLIYKGTETSLTDGTIGRLLAIDGIGEPPLHRLEERGPQQHGGTDIGFRLDPRIINLALWISAPSLSALEDKRRVLVDTFRATTVTKTLRFMLDNGEVYDADGHSAGAMVLPLEGGTGFTIKAGIQFRCADPTFYDPDGEAVTFALGGGGTAFTGPTDVPSQVGASEIDQSIVVTYEGTWRAYPVIRITGPITDAIIENETTDEKLDFTGTTIEAGDWYEIDLRYGYKTVTNSAGTNVISTLTTDSDLATWHLADDSEATDGLNSIAVSGSEVTGATKVDITYYNRYVGI